jgi:hypothetical protein
LVFHKPFQESDVKKSFVPHLHRLELLALLPADGADAVVLLELGLEHGGEL